MSEIKVNLDIIISGRVMMSEKECSKNPKDSYNSFSLEVSEYDKKKKKVNKEKLFITTRKSIVAHQSINLSVDSYKYMTGECPDFMKPKQWNSMNSKARLEAHLQRICESLGGISYTYNVLK